MQDLSRLVFYSIGVVAVNKKLTSHFVEITPIEDIPYLDGEITDNFEEYEASGKDHLGKEFNVKVDTTASIRAKWLPAGNSNRITSPDVRRGEHVAIYKFGDADEYYWATLLQDKHIRRLETVIYSFSNNREENIEDSPTTTYFFEISTHKKLIHIHTSKNDDEPFIYDIQLDTKNGNFVLRDDDDNYIFLDSKERHIKLHNKDTSYMEMDKKIINIHSLEEVNIKTKHYTLHATETMKTLTKDYQEVCDDYKQYAKKTLTTETDKQKFITTEYDVLTKKLYKQTAENFEYIGEKKWKLRVREDIAIGTEIKEIELHGPVLNFPAVEKGDASISTPIIKAALQAPSPPVGPENLKELEKVEDDVDIQDMKEKIKD